MSRKITALKAQKRNRERVNVYLDGEFAFGLARIVAAWLHVGQELSEEKISELQAEDQRESAYQQALNFISYRERSEAEVLQNLKKHSVPDELIEYVMERLRRSGLVNDQRFASAWVENRNEYRPRSRRALAYELRQRGISKEAIQEAVANLDEEELAYRAAVKQAHKFQSLDWAEFRQKMLGFLARRGFNYETAASATARVWEDERAGESDEAEQPDDYSSDEEVGL